MTRRKAPSSIPLAKLTDDQRAQAERIERDAILNFDGSVDDLEKAIGILRLGYHTGWKPLVLMHSKRTIAKFEDILGVRLRDVFEAEGVAAERSLAYVIARKLRNFWKAVSGDTPIENRQKFGPST